MYCPNCGKENKEGAKFCPGCGAKLMVPEVETASEAPKAAKKSKTSVKKSPGTKMKHPVRNAVLIVLALLLIVGGVLAGIVIKRLKAISPTAVTDLNADGHFSLILSADDVMLYIGEEKEITFTLRVYRDLVERGIGSEVSIVDENGSVLTTIPLRYSEPDVPYTEYTYKMKYLPEDDSGMTCYAVMGDLTGEPLDFYAVEHLTNEMLLECMQVGCDLQNWVDEKQLETDYLEGKIEYTELLQAVYDRLQADSRVGYAEINAINVLYSTVDHVAGIYSLPSDGTCFGGKSTTSESKDFSQNDDASDAIENEDTTGSILTEGEDFLYLDGINSITSNKFGSFCPSYNMNEPEIRKAYARHTEMRDKYVSELDYEKYDLKDANAFKVLISGGLQEAGIATIMCHGGFSKISNGYVNYFWCQKVTEDEKEATIDDVNKLLEDITGLNGTEGVAAGFYSSDNFEKSLYLFSGNQILFTSNALRKGYQNIYFDNSIIYFGTCYGLLDTRTAPFFLSHGAKFVAGWRSTASEGFEKSTFNYIFSKLKKHPQKGTPNLTELILGYSDLLESVLTGEGWLIVDPFVRGANAVTDWNLPITDPAFAGYSAYFYYQNLHFRIRETGNLSGNVEVITTLSEEDINGNIKETKRTELPELPNEIDIDFHRFENQSFYENKDPLQYTSPDIKGDFTVKNLRWGVYGIKITGAGILDTYASVTLADDSFTGKRSIEVTPYGVDFAAEVHILEADSGIPEDATNQYRKDHTDPAAGAEVTLTLLSAEIKEDEVFIGESYTVYTDAAGIFQFSDIPGGIYSMEITDAKDDKLSCSVSALILKNGYDYTKDIPYYLMNIDYWVFIHDVLLPEMGYFGLSYVGEKLPSGENPQIIAAEVLDLNLDGVEDMLLYTFVPRYCDLYATLYTIKNHEIVEVNTVQLTDQSPAGKLAWLGIMTVDGVPYLHCQRLYDFNSQAYNYMWYRYGEDGLEVAADMGYYPAAGPRNDKWHTYACNFNGKQISNAFESVKSSEIKRLERNYPGTQLEALGLPEPGTVQYLAIGVKYGAATERPSYWGTGYMHNTLRMQKYNGSNYNAYSDSLNHLTLEEFTPYLEKMAELDRKK